MKMVKIIMKQGNKKTYCSLCIWCDACQRKNQDKPCEYFEEAKFVEFDYGWSEVEGRQLKRDRYNIKDMRAWFLSEIQDYLDEE